MKDALDILRVNVSLNHANICGTEEDDFCNNDGLYLNAYFSIYLILRNAKQKLPQDQCLEIGEKIQSRIILRLFSKDRVSFSKPTISCKYVTKS